MLKSKTTLAQSLSLFIDAALFRYAWLDTTYRFMIYYYSDVVEYHANYLIL